VVVVVGRGSQGGVSTWYRRDPSGERIQASRERAKLTLRCTMDLIPSFPLRAAARGREEMFAVRFLALSGHLRTALGHSL
jgi:hypothetical protein